MNPTSSLLRICALALSLLASTVAVAVADGGEGASAGSVEPSSFSGKYTAAPTDSEKTARQKSVDTTVGEFNFITRSIARKRIEAMTRISSWIQLKQSGGKVTVHFEGRQPETCPIDGVAKGKDLEGNDAEFAAKLSGDKLVTTVTTDEGKRTNTFKLQADGSLKVTIEIASKKFETPVRYTLSYAK
ncbi:MAG: hypothetical protein JWN04_3977 [Myxococcaceae bacterium]|nr:hypothetical protein [Myxococcaceae bacterium]